MSIELNFKGLDETLSVKTHHNLYPGNDPATHFVSQSLAGKVVLITGGSKGIGAVAAKWYAKAGASLAIVARDAGALEATRAKIVSEVPGAQVITFSVDVKNPAAAEEAVEATVAKFGKLDVLVANSGIGERDDPLNWWHSFEVNIFGAYNFVRPALKHLEKSSGYALLVSTTMAQVRMPSYSDYGVSKHAVGRLVEYIALEYPIVKTFAVMPGAIDTKLSRSSGMPSEIFQDPPELAAAAFLALTSGKLDWFSGRFFDSSWDIDEVVALKDKILAQDALVSKLVVALD